MPEGGDTRTAEAILRTRERERTVETGGCLDLVDVGLSGARQAQ
jgi:hypothetical protein